MLKVIPFLVFYFYLLFDMSFDCCKGINPWNFTEFNFTIIQSTDANNCDFAEDNPFNCTYTTEQNDMKMYDNSLSNSSGKEIFCTTFSSRRITEVTLSEGWSDIEININALRTGNKLDYELCCYNNSLMLGGDYNDNITLPKVELEPNKGATHYWCEYEEYSSSSNKESSRSVLAQHYKLELQHFIITIFEVYENITIDLLGLPYLHSIEMLGSIPEYNLTENENVTVHIRLCKNNKTHEDNLINLYESVTCLNNSMNYTLSSATTCFNTSEFGFIFKTSNMGEIVVPMNACLTLNGEPIKRRCGGNYLFGAKWLEIEGSCSGSGSVMVRDLQKCEEGNYEDNNEVLKDLIDIVGGNIIEPYVIFLFARILNNIAFSELEFDVRTYSQVTSDLMDCDKVTLRSSQKKYNSTDILLESLDEALLKNGNIPNNDTMIYTKNIIARTINLTTNPTITGIAFHKSTNKITTESVNSNQYDTNNLIFLSFISQIENRNDNYVNILFPKNSLFDDESTRIISNIVSIRSKSNINEIFFSFKPFRTYRKVIKCAYWNYGKNWLWESSQGYWERLREPERNQSLLQCQSKHLTHFTILIGLDDNKYANLFTLVGCSLSLIGCTFMLITSVIFKSYRHNSRMQILMNFCLSIIIEMITIFPTDLIDSLEQEDLCLSIGVMLHYSVLSQFCWMLVIGYLQYTKFVTVFTTKPKYLLLKSCFIGWILPLLPVLLTLTINPDSYLLDEYCYLTQNGLYFGSLFPITVILSINFFIFFKIIISISCKRIKNHGNNDNLIILQFRLAVLLFFSLGLSWIFGLFAGFFESKIISYIFCVTCTLQGFILFIYFIICSIKTKKSKLKSKTVSSRT